LRRYLKFLPLLLVPILALEIFLLLSESNEPQRPPLKSLIISIESFNSAIPRARLNPQRGIHAPVGFRWTDTDRSAFQSFRDINGLNRPPGMALALSADLEAAGNSAGVSMERDLLAFQKQGSEIYLRMYPQRFPGGLTEPFGGERNTISGEPEDAVEDIINVLKGQQARLGTHFTRMIPGNEPNLEWSNGTYYQNVLPWQSNDDPTKYDAITRFYLQLYNAWEQRLKEPDAEPFRDVQLYFPPLGQDGHPDYFGGFYFYDNGKPAGNKYEKLRPAIERFRGFSWHNYWRPGHAWEDRAIVHFPDWLKQAIVSGALPAVITESGWTPGAMTPVLTEEQQQLYQLWRGPIWSWLGPIPVPSPTQDDIIDGVRFEQEVRYFIEQCSGAAYDIPGAAHAVAVWLAASNGYFQEAVGIERNGQVRRWFTDYMAWRK